MKNFRKTQIWLSFLIVFLLVLAACGGSTDEAVEDTSETDTGAIDDTTDSEAIEDEGIDATGSEEDSGELPPPPDTGSKTDAPRATPNVIASSDTAITSQPPPANRIDSGQTTNTRQLDLVLLLDATGSMADELNILQTRLDEIAAELATLPHDVTLRYGFVVYRDQAKSDSVQLFGLTNDWALFAKNLMTVTAVGGGDYPENLNDGLFHAVNSMNWNPEAAHLLILLGNAPPHPNTIDPLPLEEILALASDQNIAIFTIGNEGLNETGIEIYQQIAEAGNGRFIFVGNSPEGNPVNVPAVQPITNLTDILVEIIFEVLDEEAP
ncbi:MAG: hypothetical protein CL608_17465 [Anaerolineaceae bacterium]|nr:hypothetical protein [Anaerolineaceae bacterium]